MFGYKDIAINFLSSAQPLLWPLLLAFLVLTFFLYRRTNPPLSYAIKLLLGFMRTLALLALFAALLEPVLSYSREYQRRKKVTVLIDRSDSMEKVEQGLARETRLDSLISSPSFAHLRSNADVDQYYFGGNLSDNVQEVDRSKTALGDIIHQTRIEIISDPADYWLLMSDGNSNTGRDPADASRGLTAPVIVVNMASGSGSFDIGLGDVDYNPVLFVGEKSSLNIRLQWQNGSGRTAQVELRDSNRVIDQVSLSLSQDDGLADVTLEFTPEHPGQKILKINIPTLTDEENSRNNSRSISVKILKSKLLVLIVSASPDYEVGFLKRFLETSDRYNVELRATGENSGNLSGRFPPTQTELNRYDLVILHDPDPRRLEPYSENLRSYLSDKGGAIWLLMGDRFASAGPASWFNDLLPFYQTSRRPIRYGDFHASPSEGQLYHPSVRFGEDRSETRAAWAELPPFQSLVECDQVDKNSIVLAYRADDAGGSNRVPILGFKRSGAGKLLASAAQPFWIWGFVTRGMNDDDSNYGKLIEGVASWLTVKEDFDPIRVTPVKQVFNRGETVHFDGYAFDQGFRPVPDVTGTVKLSGGETQVELETDLIASGAGKLAAEFNSLTPGEYTYLAVIQKEGTVLNENEGKIIVEPFSLEQFDRSGDPFVLAAIARQSGGSYFEFDQFEAAMEAVDLTPAIISRHYEINIWNKGWLMLIIIGALSLEWLIRKAYQMI